MSKLLRTPEILNNVIKVGPLVELIDTPELRSGFPEGKYKFESCRGYYFQDKHVKILYLEDCK